MSEAILYTDFELEVLSHIFPIWTFTWIVAALTVSDSAYISAMALLKAVLSICFLDTQCMGTLLRVIIVPVCDLVV